MGLAPARAWAELRWGRVRSRSRFCLCSGVVFERCHAAVETISEVLERIGQTDGSFGFSGYFALFIPYPRVDQVVVWVPSLLGQPLPDLVPFARLAWGWRHHTSSTKRIPVLA